MPLALSGSPGAAGVLAAWIVTFLAHGTLLLGGAWLLTRVARSPAVGDVVWKAAAVGPLLTASVAMMASSGRSSAAAVAQPAQGLPAGTAEAWLVLPAAAVLAVWLLAAAAGIYHLERSRRRFWRRAGRRETLPDPSVVAMLRRLQDRARHRRTVYLTTSPGIGVPAAVGAAEICLPETFRALTPLQQESVLAHELGHLVRRDPRWQFSLSLLAAVFTVQPLLRPAQREARACAELLCDDFSIALTGRRQPLVESLAALAGSVWPRGPQTAALGGEDSPLVRRAARVLDRRRRPVAAPGRAAAALVGAALLAAGALLPAVAAPPAPRDPPLPTIPLPGEPLPIGKRLIVRTQAGEELQVVREADGTLRQRYTRGGVEMAPDADARGWIADVLERHPLP